MGLVEQSIDLYIDSVTEERQPDGLIHPSSASLCARRTVYAARADGKAEQFDAPTKRKFYIGHRIHEVVQRALEGSPDIDEFYAEPTIEVGPPFNMKGSADAIIRRGPIWSVVEIKSIAKGSIRYGGMPKEHHEIQARMYAFGAMLEGFTYVDATGKELTTAPVPIETIIYAYLEKEAMKIYEYEQQFTATQRADIGDYLRDINDYVEDGTALPLRLPVTKAGKKPWPCNYCPFADRCWNQDPHEIELGSF